MAVSAGRSRRYGRGNASIVADAMGSMRIGHSSSGVHGMCNFTSRVDLRNGNASDRQVEESDWLLISGMC